MRAQAIARAISEKMDRLERELNLALTRKVAEDFKDPMGPLNALSTAAMAPLGGCGLVHYMLSMKYFSSKFLHA